LTAGLIHARAIELRYIAVAAAAFENIAVAHADGRNIAALGAWIIFALSVFAELRFAAYAAIAIAAVGTTLLVIAVRNAGSRLLYTLTKLVAVFVFGTIATASSAAVVATDLIFTFGLAGRRHAIAGHTGHTGITTSAAHAAPIVAAVLVDAAWDAV
jgi:hypothetical protein